MIVVSTRVTQVNNVVGTLKRALRIRELAPDCHLESRTMGEYGTPKIDIEEGLHRKSSTTARQRLLPFPKQPGSFYHLSKVHDATT